MEWNDDVSALSMDGASAIAGRAMARRIRTEFAEMQLGIPEDEEEQQQQQQQEQNGYGEHSSARPLHKENCISGNDLIEPFPKTFEEWQKKKDKKEKKHKSKKHHKKSSKSSHSRSSSKRDRAQDEQQIAESNNISIDGKSPPIMEISIQSTNFGSSADSAVSPPRQHHASDHRESASDARSYPSIASTASSRSRTTRSTTQRRSTCGSSGGGDEAIGMAIARRSLQYRSTDLHHRSSAQSVGSYETSHLTGGPSHMSMPTHMSMPSNMSPGQSSSAMESHSHVTVEDIHQLRLYLERARMDEKQVVEIHTRLEREVQTAYEKAEMAQTIQCSIHRELQLASIEREELRRRLGTLHDENHQLKSKLRHLEDEDDEGALDNVLDNMEAKIRAMKMSKGSRSKAKEKK